uniref:aralkylamine N-acetyltransferase n=1 Tax=Heterorhabditis bacteriophora TaxID=37862 RepID=A0A1I7X0Y0_HETBA
MSSALEFRTGTQVDAAVVDSFLLNHFRVTEPITSALGATMDDVTDFFCDLRDGGLHHEKHSILVFDEDQLVAISLNDVKEFSNPSTSNTGEFNPYHDYAEDIAKGPYSQLNANRLVTFVETLEQGMQQLLGNPTHVLKIDVLCVRNDYQGRGIASQLVRRSIDHAENTSCSWVVTAATAVASQIVFAKAGFRTIHELPFSCFREDGECVYRCLPDHGRCGKLMAIPVESRNAVQNVK